MSQTLKKHPILWKYTVREIQRRPGRTLLTLLGIILGVAATVAISVTVQATRRANREMFEAVAGRTALEVVAEGLGGFEESRAGRVGDVNGVRAVVPVVQTPAGLFGASGVVPVLALGIDPARDGAARDYVLRAGQRLGDQEGILLEASFAASQRLELGQAVRLATFSGVTTLPILGLLEPRGAATFNGGAVVFLPLEVAQRRFGLSGQINSLQLVLDEAARPGRVETELRAQLPPGLTVQTPAARGAMARDGLVPIQQGLASLSASSLVAGGFLVLNAFLMNLGERRRQLAMLRALGATRRQVTRMLLREALLLGGVGTLFGMLAGMGLSMIFRRVLGELLLVELPALDWSSGPFLLALILGPGMALAATVVPARRAARRAPLEDLFNKGSATTDTSRRWSSWFGVALLILVLGIVVGVVRAWFDPDIAAPFLAPTMAAFLAGCVLVMPLLLTPLSRLAGVVLRPFLHPEGNLALRQLARHPGRTSLTAGVLLVAVVLAVGFGQAFTNNLRHIHNWFDRIMSTDFYLRGAWPDATTAITTAQLPQGFDKEVAALAEVERVSKFNFVLARTAERPAVVLAYEFHPDEPLPLALEEGEPADVLARLLQGEVVMGTALAQRLHLHAGDTLTLATRQGPRALRIAGTVAEYTGGGMALYMDWNAALPLFNLQGVHTLAIRAQPDRAERLAPPLQALCAERGVLFQSNAESRQMFHRQMAGFLACVWMLLGLLFVVASLGIVNTLTLNVLEQTRELGVLRAVGMRRGQVGRMILAQGLALAVISLVPGALAGLSLTYMMYLATPALVGQRVPFHVDPGFVAGCFAAALAITLLAALIPARRAARMQVVRALQYE